MFFRPLVSSLAVLLTSTTFSNAAAANNAKGDKAGLSDYARQALAFETSQHATGSVLENSFYSVDKSSGSLPAGTLLHVEQTLNTSLFVLPPATALSRIAYQSKNINGTLTPVSAFVLWPHSPRHSSDGYQVVAYAHGTSGYTPQCAPSNLRNLWQHFLAPYQLALQGYVVIATDYAGLGISKYASGEPTVFEWLNAASHANDIFYSVQAAQSAFPSLSKSFVVAGHSEGGGAAWACAERQAKEPVKGYLGTVAVAPVTDILENPPAVASGATALMSPGIAVTFPEFSPSDILTDTGLETLALINSTGGCLSVVDTLIPTVPITKPDALQNPYVKAYNKLVNPGGKKISGPMLVIQGTADPTVNPNVTTITVEATALRFPDARIVYRMMDGVSHVAGLTSSQWIWMDWIAERFRGVEQPKGLVVHEEKAAREVGAYQKELDWWVALSTEAFETP